MSDNKRPEKLAIDDITRHLLSISSVQGAWVGVDVIEGHASVLSRKARSHFLLNVFRLASEQDELNDIDLTKSLIVKRFLPYCIEEIVQDNEELSIGAGQTSFSLFRLRDSLGDWVRDFPIDHRLDLVNELYDRLSKELASYPRLIVLQVISSIGYRTSEIVEAIRKVIGGGSDLIDNAVGTLIGLGVAPHNRMAVIELAKDHLRSLGPVHSVRCVVNSLCGPSNMDLAFDLLTAANSLDSQGYDKMMALSAVASATDRCQSGLSVHTEVWSKMREHRETIGINAQFAYGCDTPLTVADYLTWMAERDHESNPDIDIDIDITKSRIEELTKPSQLAGFDQANVASVNQTLVSFATKDTRMESMYVTACLRSKKDAWELLQCLNDDPRGDLLYEAVWGETNSSAAHEVAIVAASARIDTLDSRLCAQIKSASQHKADSEDANWSRQLALIELAHGCGSREAYEAMLEFGYLHKGEVLQSVVDAIVDLAIERIRCGESDVVEKLVSQTKTEKASHHRAAAVAAYCQLMINGRLSSEQHAQAWTFFQDPSLDSLAHQESLEAIACSGLTLDDATISEIKRVAKSDATDVGWRAWEVLIRRDLVDSQVEPQLLTRLEMSRDLDHVQFISPKSLNSWQAYLAGLLYRHRPSLFAAPLCQLLRESRADCVHQVVDSIEASLDDLPQSIAQAFADRVLASNYIGRADTALTLSLGRIAPKRLVEIVRTLDWREWMVAGRAALCRSLVEAARYDEDCRSVANVLFVEFMRDAAFQVRRSAYRALSNLAGEYLLDVIDSWTVATNPELTIRAAEAIQWIPRSVCSDEQINEIGLLWHLDPKVREIAKTAVSNRRDREWADDYLSEIANAVSSNQLLPKAYRCSRALVALGDDLTIDQIEDMLVNAPMSPRIQKWLSKTLKDLKKHWKQRVSKWSDPWTHATGTLERLEGRIRAKESEERPAVIWLWRQQRRTQSERYSWGGTIEDVGDRSCGPFMHVGNEIEILLEDRPPRTVMIFGSSQSSNRTSRLTFYGNSEYPEKVVS